MLDGPAPHSIDFAASNMGSATMTNSLDHIQPATDVSLDAVDQSPLFAFEEILADPTLTLLFGIVCLFWLRNARRAGNLEATGWAASALIWPGTALDLALWLRHRQARG